jgi:sec-independent protein translocase protein TatB
MFGLTFEKLIIIGVVAAFVIGPERLPHYASVLAKFVRQLRDFTNGAKTRMKEEMGPDFDEVEWKKLDPRQYDPRRIIRDALLEDPVEATTPAPVKPSATMAAGAAATAAGSAGALNLDKDAPLDPLAAGPAADPGFDDGPGISLSVPASAPDYLSGRKSAEREASEQAATVGAAAPALTPAPYDSEAT